MSQHRKTCKRWNAPGHAHALTFSCFQRRPFLNRDRSRQWLVEAIDLARQQHEFHIWSYVIMPEHAHALIFPLKPIYDISKILATVKLSVTRKALNFVRREAPDFLTRMLDRDPDGTVHHRFWQRGGGYDSNVIDPKSAWVEIEYMHANPVRRGLCASPQDWHWSSATDYIGEKAGRLQVDRETVPIIADS